MIPTSWGMGYFYSLSAHYLSYMQLYSDSWLHGDTLYPSISPFPPLVLRSLKVTSVWLQMQTSPMHFIAELYIWTPLISSVLHPPDLLHACFILGLSPPPTTTPDTFHRSDCHKLPLEQNQLILASWRDSEVQISLIWVKNCRKHHTNQTSNKSNSPLKDALCTTLYRCSLSY